MPHPELATNNRRWLYITVGWLSFILACAGGPIPMVPTTPFVLISAWAFSKSSPRFDRWLVNHRWFGLTVRRWRSHRVIPLHIKLMSLSTLFGMIAMSAVLADAPWWVLVAQSLFVGYATWFAANCPSKVPELTE